MNKFNRTKNFCPCNIHTFETGNFRWSQTIKKSADPIESKKGLLGQCHYVERNNITAVGWHIKNENNKYLLESSNFHYTKTDGADTMVPIEGNTKDEYIWIAPAVLFKKPSAGSAEHTISITLKTIGPTCNGHRAELVLADLPINKNFPSSASITDTILTEAQFEDKVTAEMTAQNYTACASIGGDDFSTNNKTITIKTTYTPSATGVKYIGIRDKSNGIDDDYAKLQIHDIAIYVSGVDDTDIPTNFPIVTAKIKSDNGRRSGKIELRDKILGIDCIWCWSNGQTFQNIPPDLKGVKSGIYYVKGVNTKLGYTLPIQKFTVPLKKTASPLDAYPPYNKAQFFTKQYLLYSNSVGGMKGCVQEMMKITILDYLYKILYPQTRPNPLYPDWVQFGELLAGTPSEAGAGAGDNVMINNFLPPVTATAWAGINLVSFLFPAEGVIPASAGASGFQLLTGLTGVKTSLTTVIDSTDVAGVGTPTTYSTEMCTNPVTTRKLKNELQNLLGPAMTAAEEANWDVLSSWNIVAGGTWIGDILTDEEIENWGNESSLFPY